MGFFAALRFLTVIPLPSRRQARPEEVGRSLGYFPLVGLLLGLLIMGLDRGLELVLPTSVVSGLLVVVLVLATGAIHLDGFIDTCDGLVAGRTPQQRWEVMRDSRVGAFGVVGACCLLLLKYVSLAGLPESSRMAALVLMPVLGRWAVVCSISAFPYARPEGLGKAFKDGATWPGVALATIIALAASVGFLQLKGLAIMFGVGLVTLTLSLILKRKFAGLTGDTYGAVIEVAEVTAVILAIAIPSWSW
ncbi:MAG: adenosylcobinamide-GDP ribazoletransferase [Chloroflexi bacterium]|nr:adenosylcobinamide-GDP ribazoletransferase [Chloroflexota bacterium]